ncbi:VpsF family polysaccharide biosynthesis protein [Derxia lacustris]|uniref:VpsF family polysaccharide biosynthesis protein n=1 Tax=Derxia lacustris TaxID=764842 RepID=UPI000A16F19A|nr:VpsF family polysaccharide biosynthesis protein [Derxia lacustris]
MRSANPLLGDLAAALVFSSLALYQLIADALLFQLGIPYTSAGGSLLVKLHPGTWVGLLAFVVALAAHGNPVAVLAAALRRHPPLGLWLGAIVFLLGYSIARYGPSGAAFLIDTLIMPAVTAVTLLALAPQRRATAFRLVIGLMLFNAAMALVETARHEHFVLYTVGGIEPHEDLFRATALTGHPLNGALVTGTLAPLLLTLRIPAGARALLLGYVVLALLAYGGRTSFLLTLLFLGGYLALTAAVKLTRGRFTYAQITGGSVVVLLGIGLLVAVVMGAGLGERIFTKLKVDDSAEVRARIWSVFGLMSEQQLIAGASPAEIAHFIFQLALQDPLETIENFWINMYLQFGAIGFLPFVAAMVGLLRWLWRLAPGPARVSILIFVVVSSSNNSLSAKGSMLTTVVAALVCHASRRRDRRLERRRARRTAAEPGEAAPAGAAGVLPDRCAARPQAFG